MKRVDRAKKKEKQLLLLQPNKIAYHRLETRRGKGKINEYGNQSVG